VGRWPFPAHLPVDRRFTDVPLPRRRGDFSPPLAVCTTRPLRRHCGLLVAFRSKSTAGGPGLTGSPHRVTSKISPPSTSVRCVHFAPVVQLVAQRLSFAAPEMPLWNRSAHAVPPGFSGFLRSVPSGLVASRSRPWGSFGFRPARDPVQRPSRLPTIPTNASPFGAFPFNSAAFPVNRAPTLSLFRRPRFHRFRGRLSERQPQGFSPSRSPWCPESVATRRHSLLPWAFLVDRALTRLDQLTLSRDSFLLLKGEVKTILPKQVRCRRTVASLAAKRFTSTVVLADQPCVQRDDHRRFYRTVVPVYWTVPCEHSVIRRPSSHPGVGSSANSTFSSISRPPRGGFPWTPSSFAGGVDPPKKNQRIFRAVDFSGGGDSFYFLWTVAGTRGSSALLRRFIIKGCARLKEHT